MEVNSSLRFVRISPQKLRLVCDMIRGRQVNEAFQTLRFSAKKGARIVKKVLESAVANADYTGKIDVDALYVKRIMVDEGAAWKRWIHRAMGRATPIRKRTSHLRIVLDEK